MVDLEEKARRRENVARQVGGIGVRHDQFGKRVVLQLGEEIHAGGALQVVEAVAVLQLLQLLLEHEVEGGAEEAAERHLLLGKAADPEVDVVEAAKAAAGEGAGSVEEVEAVQRCLVAAENDGQGSRAFAGKRGLAGNGVVCAVGGDEVDQRFRMLQVLREVDPARVGGQATVAGHVIEFTARRLQGRNAGLTAARQVDGREIEREAQQVVAQSLGLEFVDLVGALAGGAAHDGPGRLFRGERAVQIERQRVEERLYQAEPGILLEGGVEAVDLIQQHRVAEAVDGMRELGDDRRIDVAVVHLGCGKEHVDLGLNLARELLEHEVLILHLGAELRRLEQPLAVPHQGRQVGWNCSDRNQQPLVQERHFAGRRRRQRDFLGVFDEAVVLGMEHVVDGGQADVLVDASVAGHEVLGQQLVVVGAGKTIINASNSIGIDRERGAGLAAERVGGMRDVGQERVAGAQRADSKRADRRRRVAFHRHVVVGPEKTVGAEIGHQLGEAVRAWDEVAVGIDFDHRHVDGVIVAELNAQQVARLRLHHAPGRHAAELDVVRRCRTRRRRPDRGW